MSLDKKVVNYLSSIVDKAPIFIATNCKFPNLFEFIQCSSKDCSSVLESIVNITTIEGDTLEFLQKMSPLDIQKIDLWYFIGTDPDRHVKEMMTIKNHVVKTVIMYDVTGSLEVSKLMKEMGYEDFVGGDQVAWKVEKHNLENMFDLARRNRLEGKYQDAYTLLQTMVDTFSSNELNQLLECNLWYELLINCFNLGLKVEGMGALCELWNRNGKEKWKGYGKHVMDLFQFYGDGPFEDWFTMIDGKVYLTDKIPENRYCPILDKFSPLIVMKKSVGKKIAFLCCRSNDPWDGEKSRSQGIGGSEECVVYLAENLSSHGYDVTIYGEVPESCTERFPWSNPRYCCADTFDHHNKSATREWDYVVVWRQRKKVGVKEMNTKKIVLWEHDLLGDGYFSTDCLVPVSHTVWVSKFQQDYNSRIFLDPLLNSVVIPNGVNISQFSTNIQRNEDRCIYASCYVRGLKNLLKLWPKIKKEFPSKRLDIFYGWNTLEQTQPDVGRELRSLLKSVEGLDVVEHGRIGHEKLANEFLSSGYWLYPCDFLETFCITAVKAQLAGAIPVYRNYGALKTSVQYGYKCDSIDEYMDTLRNAFKSSVEEKEKLRGEMREWAIHKYDWEKVGREWRKMLSECKEGKVKSPYGEKDVKGVDWKKWDVKVIDQFAVDVYYKGWKDLAKQMIEFLIKEKREEIGVEDLKRIEKNYKFFETK